MRRLGWLVGFLGLVAAGCTDDVPPSLTLANDTNSGTNTVTNQSNNASNNNDIDLGANSTPCDTSANCNDPEVCVFDQNTGEGTCGPAHGGNTGHACTSGTDCASGLCLSGLCADPCGSESDCPAGFTCANSSVPLSSGTSVTLDVCVPEAQPCLANANCTGTEVCVVDRSGASVDLNCAAPVGAGALDDACTADADCASNLCLSNVCTLPCERPTDCASDGSFQCDASAVTLGNGGAASINVCKPRPSDVCLSDAQCSGGQRCVATRSVTDVEFHCGTGAAGGETGATCASDNECAQRLCINNICAGPCQGDGDCAAADFSCQLTPVSVGNTTDNAQLCVPPVTCTQNDDCKTNEVCYIHATAQGANLFCRAKNVGGGNLGQVCSNTQECSNNYCLDTRFRDVCAIPCVDSADCTRSGYVCQPVDVNGDAVKMCTPAAPVACASDEDCATQTDCAVLETTAGGALETVCVPATGGDSTGVACTTDTDCASLLCLDGACAAPCDDSTQCAGNQLCNNVSVTKGAATTTLNVCQTFPQKTCDETSDCLDGVRVCSDIRANANNIYESFCALPNTAAAGLMGATCASPNECRENICLSASKTCSVVCNSDDDCAAGMGCTTFRMSSNNVTTYLGFCIDSCGDNGDCSNGNVCTISSDFINDDVDQVCEAPRGTKDLGESCANGDECQTGLCLRTLAYTATACASDAACAANETCECPVDQPSCTTSAKRCATEELACTRLCNDATDCAGVAGNALTACSTDTVVTRPVSNTAKTISTCSRP